VSFQVYKNAVVHGWKTLMQLNSTQLPSTNAGVRHLNVRIYVTLLCKEKLHFTISYSDLSL